MVSEGKLRLVFASSTVRVVTNCIDHSTVTMSLTIKKKKLGCQSRKQKQKNQANQVWEHAL